MAKRFYVAAGLALGVLFGYSVLPRHVAPTPSRSELAARTVPDVDGDGQPDAIVVLAPETAAGHPSLALKVTKGGFIHALFDLDTQGPVRLVDEAARVRALDERGRELGRAWFFRAAGAKQADLVASNGPQARRYVWVDRGFLKLDAQTAIPGFSAGLVMLGDPASTLAAISGRPEAATGLWQQPVAPALPLRVTLDAHARVSQLGYENARMSTQLGVHPGSALADMEGHYPGARRGDRWVSPRYGLVATLDAHDRASGISIGTPWNDAALEPPAPKRAPARIWPGAPGKAPHVQAPHVQGQPSGSSHGT